MKFSIVTPVYNGEKYLAETIKSVLGQAGNFEIEYIIRDGRSTDATMAIAESYAKKVEANEYPIACRGVTLAVVSEKDSGMYGAINKGFSTATGDVFAWINADDFYLPGAFAKIAAVFAEYPETLWLKGKTVILKDSNMMSQRLQFFRQKWIAAGLYGRYAPFINQDSVFWKKELWQKAGPIDSRLRLAGDYALWTAMARYEPLYSLDAETSCYRYVANSLGQNNMHEYRAEQRMAVPEKNRNTGRVVKIFFWIKNRFGELLPISIFNILYRNVFSPAAMAYFAVGPAGNIEKKMTRDFQA